MTALSGQILATARAFASALIPGTCALCGLHAPEPICRHCATSCFGRPVPRCPCCAIALPPTPAANRHDAGPPAAGNHCPACTADPPAFDATVAAADYAPPCDQLALALKFGGRLPLAGAIARRLIDAILADARGAALMPDLLVPVPLGPRRLAQRGYNQALEIARPLSSALGLPLAGRLVVRGHDTEAQARLPLAARRGNMRGAFALAPDSRDTVAGRHVGVVDDVMTTGATLDALAMSLKAHGARRVTNFVFARTPRP